MSNELDVDTLTHTSSDFMSAAFRMLAFCYPQFLKSRHRDQSHLNHPPSAMII